MGDSDWPGMAHVFEISRHVIIKKTGQERVEGVSRGHESEPGAEGNVSFQASRYTLYYRPKGV